MCLDNLYLAQASAPCRLLTLSDEALAADPCATLAIAPGVRPRQSPGYDTAGPSQCRARAPNAKSRALRAWVLRRPAFGVLRTYGGVAYFGRKSATFVAQIAAGRVAPGPRSGARGRSNNMAGVTRGWVTTQPAIRTGLPREFFGSGRIGVPRGAGARRLHVLDNRPAGLADDRDAASRRHRDGTA